MVPATAKPELAQSFLSQVEQKFTGFSALSRSGLTRVA